MKLAVVVGVVALAGSAHADPEKLEHKSGKTATYAALITTVAGAAMCAGGAAIGGGGGQLVGLGSILALVGPSAGHIYAGEGWHAAGGTLLRVGGLFIVAAGAFHGVFKPKYDSAGRPTEDDGTDPRAVMILGGAVVLGSTLYDIVDAHDAASRANAKLQVMPTPLVTPSGMAPGISLGGRF